MYRRIGILALAAATLLGCSDDSTVVPTGDVGADTGSDVSADVADQCDGVAVGANPGDDCTATSRCEEGLQCSQMEGDDVALCRQLCVPGTCESVCSADEVCAPLTDSPGTGVCAAAPVGDRAPYEVCSDEVGRCAPDADCIVESAGDTGGICLPHCDAGTCPEVDGRGGQCVIIVGASSAPTHCAPSCSGEGSDDECPGNTRCYASGTGFVCAYPQE